MVRGKVRWPLLCFVLPLAPYRPPTHNRQFRAGRLRPLLRPVEDAADLNRAVRHAVNHDVGQGREDELAPSSHPAAGAPEVREVFEAFATL